jgi:hypothetical protein
MTKTTPIPLREQFKDVNVTSDEMEYVTNIIRFRPILNPRINGFGKRDAQYALGNFTDFQKDFVTFKISDVIAPQERAKIVQAYREDFETSILSPAEINERVKKFSRHLDKLARQLSLKSIANNMLSLSDDVARQKFNDILDTVDNFHYDFNHERA